MVKARFLLCIIFVFSVVGSISASKAKIFRILAVPGVDGRCTSTKITQAIITNVGPFTGSFSTTTTTAACPLTIYDIGA
jgi:hypothetical protein